MPKFTISQQILDWLKKNMHAAEGSVEQVVERLIEHYKKGKSAKPSGRSGKAGSKKAGSKKKVAGKSGKVYKPRLRDGKLSPRLPDLTGAKIVSAQVNGRPVSPHWNIVRAEVFAVTGSVKALEKLPYKINKRSGKMGSEYQYISKLDVSVRGVRAIYACRDAVHAALLHDIKLDIQFSRQRSSKKERIVVGIS